MQPMKHSPRQAASRPLSVPCADLFRPVPRMYLRALQKYRYRLIVDESLSLGVLGARGRGAAEHFGFDPEDVEIVGGSMGERMSGPGWLW